MQHYGKDVWMNMGFLFISLDNEELDSFPLSDVDKLTIRNIGGN